MTRKTFKLLITSPEKWELVNPSNKEIKSAFLKEKSTRCSQLTIRGYDSDLTILFTYILENLDNKCFVDVKKLELSAFFSYCVETLRWNSSRFNRMRSTISSTGIFLEKFMDDIYPNYSSKILKTIESAPKSPAREKTILSDEQISSVFAYLESEKEYQIACWFALSIASGSRFSELLRFTVDIIDPTHLAFQDLFIECLKSIRGKGRGRNGKALTKYIVKDLFLEHYNKWLPIREEILKKNNKISNVLFIKNNGEPIKDGTVRGWVKKIEDFLGVNYYPHSSRHFLATYLSKAGIPYPLIQEIFSWESSEMVKVYDDQKASDKVWPELQNLKNHLENKG